MSQCGGHKKIAIEIRCARIILTKLFRFIIYTLECVTTLFLSRFFTQKCVVW